MGNWIHFGIQRCQKYALHKKKASNKSCSELNFVQRSPRALIFISPTSEAMGLQRSVHLKSYNVRKWKSPLASLLGKTDMCAHWLFCTKFNSEQLLFEPFFDVMHIFGSVESQSESNFPFLYIIRFQTYWSFESPISTHGGDRLMRLRTFLYEIQF